MEVSGKFHNLAVVSYSYLSTMKPVINEENYIVRNSIDLLFAKCY